MSIAAIAVVSLCLHQIGAPIDLSSHNSKAREPGCCVDRNQSFTFLFRHLTTTPVVLSTCSVGFSQSYRSPNPLLPTLLMIFLHVCPLSLVRAHCTTISASMETRPQKKRECKRTPAGGQEILIPAFDSFFNPLEGTGRPSI